MWNLNLFFNSANILLDIDPRGTLPCECMYWHIFLMQSRKQWTKILCNNIKNILKYYDVELKYQGQNAYISYFYLPKTCKHAKQYKIFLWFYMYLKLIKT